MRLPRKTVEIAPAPSALIESLRGLGYSPEAALADLIDNSIGAGATTVTIDIEWNDGRPRVALVDDGQGMDADRLIDAMRLGGRGPSTDRSAVDLGRFGLGLKTASLSQCRSLEVITRRNGATAALVLDIDVVAAVGWVAEVPTAPSEHPLVHDLLQRESGTAVVWDHLDELSGLMGLPKEAFYLRLEEIRAHLGMVFHRFINGDATRLAVTLNGRLIKPWDPFQTSNAATIELPSERIRHGGLFFTVKPYVLPHRDRFASDAEYEAAGGPGGWRARQGFYIYRGKRLLVPGSWLGLGGVRTWTRDEASRLARIHVDLPTGLDRDWRIDVRKSQARPPGVLRTRLTDIARRCRDEAREVFAFRGQGARIHGMSASASAVWLATAGPAGARYRVNRDHPVIAAYRHASAGKVKSFDAVLSILERSVPVERIWLDVSEAEGVEAPVLEAADRAQLSEQLAELGKLLPKTLSVEERVNALILSLPGDLTRLKIELARKLEEQQ
jgi:hypothetical protein